MHAISFLGLCVSPAGVQPDPANFEKIRSWPLTLPTRTHVRESCRLASYYRNFIPRFPCIAAPLTNLRKREKQVIWTEVDETAAKMFIDHLTSSPVLTFPDSNNSFLFTRDESGAGARIVPFRLSDHSKGIRLMHTTHVASQGGSRGILCATGSSTPCGGV